jgi:glycosyltransferase involved in cell wall biosynthesis
MTAGKIVVLLPAYNEADTIAPTLRDFHAALPEAELWVIDNASTDGTGGVARGVLAELGAGGGVLTEARKGKANAVRHAFRELEADVYLMADADCTYPAARAREMIAPVLAGQADMVVGDRHSGGHYASENKRPMHGAGNRLVQFLVNTLFGAKLTDILSGYRAFTRRFVKTYPIVVEGFEIEADMTLHALDTRFRIVEIPVEYRDRPEGSSSKLDTWRDGARVLWVIVQLFRYYRPMLFFGSASALMLVIGIAAGIPAIDDWLRYRYVYHLPLAVLAASSVVMSTVLFAVGLILDGLAADQRRRFEMGLLRDG